MLAKQTNPELDYRFDLESPENDNPDVIDAELDDAGSAIISDDDILFERIDGEDDFENDVTAEY